MPKKIKRKMQSEKQRHKLEANNLKLKAKTSLTAQVFNFSGKTSKILLPEEVFKVNFAPQTLAQAVRVYLANQRAGTAKTLRRGEVRGGGRKPWRQKGTGRARAGSIRAPHWRGGGVVFGPTPRDFSLEIPKKIKTKALFGALSSKLATGEVRVVDNFEKINPKTSELARDLKKLDLSAKKVLWVVDGQSDNLIRAGRNLPNLSFCRVEDLTTLKVLTYPILIFNKSAIEKLKGKVKG